MLFWILQTSFWIPKHPWVIVSVEGNLPLSADSLDNSISVRTEKLKWIHISLFSTAAGHWKNPFCPSLWKTHLVIMWHSCSHFTPVTPAANKPILMCLSTCYHWLFWYFGHILFPCWAFKYHQTSELVLHWDTEENDHAFTDLFLIDESCDALSLSIIT